MREMDRDSNETEDSDAPLSSDTDEGADKRKEIRGATSSKFSLSLPLYFLSSCRGQGAALARGSVASVCRVASDNGRAERTRLSKEDAVHGESAN